MDPVTFLLATLLAAAASDEVQKQARDQKKPDAPPEPDLDADLAEALDLLGENWPQTMSPADWALMELMETLGQPVSPWTHAQLVSFGQGTLMCPLGHTLEDARMKVLDFGVSMAPLTQDKGSRVTADSGLFDTEYDLAGGLISCGHPDHTDADRLFWFPFRFLDMHWK